MHKYDILPGHDPVFHQLSEVLIQDYQAWFFFWEEERNKGERRGEKRRGEERKRAI